MTPEQEQEQLDALARSIKLKAQSAFDEMMTRINAGETPRDAIEAVTAQFSGQYYAELSSAFSAVLDSAIGIAEIKQWPVGDVALSEHLYRHTAQVNAVTRQLIQNQAKGFVQMRDLAMQIYEGYRFKDDPLKVKAKLPKYLREALRDPAIDAGFARIVAQIRVNQLKTPALKAAYSQMLDALEQEAGAARLKNLLRTAWYERNRYFANRIAQTELHRAYSNQVAQEIMADDEAVWVKYQMSPTHPRVDICDRHAGLNAWGKGKGVYPKAKAPKPPAHPHCRCTVRPAYEIDGEPGQPIKDAEQRFMNRLSPYDQRLIAGSRARLEAFKNGRSLESIYNAATRPEYRWKRLGDRLPDPPVLVATIDEIQDFLQGNGNEPIPIAIAPKDISATLGVNAGAVFLSRYTADKQKKHPEITARHYAGLLQKVLNSGERLYDRKHHATVIYSENDPHVAVLKATQDKKWIFLQSFRRTDQKNINSLRKRVGG